MQKPVEVSSTLTLTSGVLDIDNEELTLTTSSSVSRSSGYIRVDGTGVVVQNLANGSGALSYTFEVGVENYTPFTVNLTSGTRSSAALSMRITPGKHPSPSVADGYLNQYWVLEASGITSPVYNVTFSYAQSLVVGAESTLEPVKFSPDATTENFPSFSLDQSGNAITWNNLTSFSDFTADGDETALPVELVFFNGKQVGESIQLNWGTATEVNNEGFEIYHAHQGSTFELIGFVPGNGTVNDQNSYTFLHKDPVQGQNFYRLKQIDFDGKYEVFDPINVIFESKIKPFAVDIYPQPASLSGFNLSISTPDEELPVQIRLYDLTGRPMMKVEKSVEALVSQPYLEFDTNIAAGLYTLQVSQGNQKVVKTIIVK
jgi:hypothetical protein